MNIQILRLENRVATSGVELDGNDPKCPKLEPGQVVSISGDDTVVVSGRRVEFASLVEERDGDTVVRRDPVTGERAEEIGTQWYVNGEEKLLSVSIVVVLHKWYINLMVINYCVMPHNKPHKVKL